MPSTSPPTVRTIRHTTQTPPQREFWNSHAKKRLFVGGVGSGKTRAGVVECFRQPPNSFGMVLAPTYPMLRDATLRTFLELATKADILEEFNKAEMRAKLAGNRTVLFRSADNPDRLRGPNLGWFWLDEAAMMPHSVWLIMIGRLRESPGLAWCTTTPRGKNWLYNEFTKGGDDHALIRASSRTNPFLPSDFIASLVGTYDHAFAQQEVEGEFVDDSLGQLFPEFWVERMVSAARAKDAAACPVTGRVIAADLSEGTGRDRFVAVVRDDLGLLEVAHSDRIGIPEAAGVLNRLMLKWAIPQDRIIFDAGGRGKDLPRYLEQYRITEAIPYLGSRSGGQKWANLRSRVAWRLRQRLDPERPLRLAPEQPDAWHPLVAYKKPTTVIQPAFVLTPAPDRSYWPGLREELLALRYSLVKAKIALEPKEAMAKRLGRSPDYADALLMSFVLGDD